MSFGMRHDLLGPINLSFGPMNQVLSQRRGPKFRKIVHEKILILICGVEANFILII